MFIQISFECEEIAEGVFKKASSLRTLAEQHHAHALEEKRWNGERIKDTQMEIRFPEESSQERVQHFLREVTHALERLGADVQCHFTFEHSGRLRTLTSRMDHSDILSGLEQPLSA